MACAWRRMAAVRTSGESGYGVAEIAVTTNGGKARRHRLTRFALAIRHSGYFCADP